MQSYHLLILAKLGNGFVLPTTTICMPCEMYPLIRSYVLELGDGVA